MDVIVPRVAYDRLKRVWGEEAGPRGWLWVYLVLGVLAMSLCVSGLVYVRWMRRYGELMRMGVKPGWWKVWGRGEGYEPVREVEDVEGSGKDEVDDLRAPLIHAR
jgi:hypothetical protein